MQIITWFFHLNDQSLWRPVYQNFKTISNESYSLKGDQKWQIIEIRWLKFELISFSANRWRFREVFDDIWLSSAIGSGDWSSTNGAADEKCD